LKIKIFLNDFATFEAAMKERVETNVKETNDFDFDSVPSDDGENEDEDSVEEDCLDLSLITNDELTHIILEDVEHRMPHMQNRQNKKKSKNKKGTERPKWIASYNFLCLLNLPVMISLYGPPCLYWEGSGMGEKVLQQLKALWIGFRRNWQVNTMTDVYKQALLTRMNARRLPNWFSQQEIGLAEAKKEEQYEGKLFHCYNNFIALFKKFRDNRPVSVVQLNSGTFGVVFGIDCGRYTMVPISFNTYVHRKLGMCYFKVTLDDKNLIHNVTKEDFSRYYILLPELIRSGIPIAGHESLYTMIDWKWKKIDNDGNMIMY
jgi:hypothetical protein